MCNERFLHVLQPNRFVHLFIETNKKKWNYYFTTNIMICLLFFCVWKLSECNWLRELKLSQNKVVVFSLPYYSLHRKSNQLKIGWAILCDALKMTDTISIINGHMFRFVVSYRDCVEWLLFEIDMSSSSAPQFSFLFVKYSLFFFWSVVSVSLSHVTAVYVL